MNSGLIASRYAAAFDELVKKHRVEDKAYDQICVILSAMSSLPKFNQAFLDKEIVSLEKRTSLLRASVAPDSLLDEIVSLLALMEKKGRSDFFKMALLDFTIQYREEHNIIMVQVTVAREDVNISPILKKLLRDEFGKTAVITQKVDPDIIGGFVYEDWNHRMDASVRGALKRTLDGLTEKNNRIV